MLLHGQDQGAHRGGVSEFDPPAEPQVSAALSAFDRELLGNHIRTCVADDIRAGHDEVIDELLDTLQRMMK